MNDKLFSYTGDFLSTNKIINIIITLYEFMLIFSKYIIARKLELPYINLQNKV